MKIVIHEGQPYVRVEDLVYGEWKREDLLELLTEKYKDTGRRRVVQACSKKDKQDILAEYAELVSLWSVDEVLGRLAMKYKIKKTLIKRWVYTPKEKTDE